MNDYFRSLKLYEQLKLVERTSVVHANIVNVYFKTGDLKCAERHWQYSFDYASSTRDSSKLAKMFVEKELLYFENGDRAAAKNWRRISLIARCSVLFTVTSETCGGRKRILQISQILAAE